ncbi:MAG: hypothetical protein WCP11_00180 [Candidatus Saccharibacteria bacterium]
MKEIIKKNAIAIITLSTAVFALLVWVYVARGTISNTNSLIIAGLGFVLLDVLILWVMSTTKSTKKTNKRKGKK